MQRQITGILCVWIAALALWASTESPHWIVGERGSGGLTQVAPCFEGNCPSASYERFDEVAAWLNPLNNSLSPREGERLFVMLGRLTKSASQVTALVLMLTGMVGLLGFGLNGPLSAPRVSLLLLSSVLIFSLGFISTVPTGNVLGRLLLHGEPGPGYSLSLFAVLIGAFGSALVWQPIRKANEVMPNQRLHQGVELSTGLHS